MIGKKMFRLAKLILFSSIISYLVVLYISIFIYRGVINLNYLLLSLCLLGSASYNLLNHQKKQDNYSVHRSIKTLYIFIFIFFIILITLTRYLPNFTYMQAYGIIREALSTEYSDINLIQDKGNYTRDYPYNIFSNKTYIYKMLADGVVKHYYFNQYTGEYYEIEGNEGTIYRKY